MKNRKFQVLLLAFTLILCQICGGYAQAIEMDTSKSFTLSVQVNGQAECYAKVGDVVTVTLRITQDGAEDTFDLYTTEDTLLFDPEYLELLAPNENTNEDDKINEKDGITSNKEPGELTSIVPANFIDISGISQGKLYFSTNPYMEGNPDYGVDSTLLTVPADTWLISFQVKMLKEGTTTVRQKTEGAHKCAVKKGGSGNIYETSAEDAVIHITASGLAPQDALTITSANTMTYGETLTLAAVNNVPGGSVSYRVSNGTGKATVEDGKLTATQAGTVTVTATKTADGYDPISATQEITINKAKPSGGPTYALITEAGKKLADAGLDAKGIKGVDGKDLAGDIAWNDGGATAVAKNTKYKWTFTPNDSTNYAALTGEVLLYSVSGDTGSGGNTGGGHTGGGNTGSGGAPSTPSIPNTPSTPDAPSGITQFGDVPAGAYYENAVAWAVEQGVTTGVSEAEFRPTAVCNRGQLVTFLWRASGSPEPNAANPFADVGEGTYYAKAVAWAYENGITTGAVGGGFDPTGTVTRAQVVMMLYRLAGSPSVKSSAFTDVPAEKYYASAVAWAVEQGITTGVSADLFSPNMDCDRAQIVTFLFRDFAKK